MENDSFVLLVHLCSRGLKSSREGGGRYSLIYLLFLCSWSIFLILFSSSQLLFGVVVVFEVYYAPILLLKIA